MTGSVTMLGISRWAGQGGSYRTVQRFFSTVLPWAMLFWVFFRAHLHRPDDVYILAGDEVVVSKAGHHTHGLDGGSFDNEVLGKYHGSREVPTGTCTAILKAAGIKRNTGGG